MTAEPGKDDPDGPSLSPRLRRNLRSLWVVLAILATGAATAGIVGRHRQDAKVARWTADAAIPTVTILQPRRGPTVSQLVQPGEAQPWYEAPIYARVNGYLKRWYFDFGARVKQGEVLAEIDAPDLDAQLAAAQARLNSANSVIAVRRAEMEFARTTYERWRGSPQGIVSVQERENKKADYRTATANLDAAVAAANADRGEIDRLTALESFKRIVAPFDGIVTARETDVGALINAGSGQGPELFRVADTHEMRIFVRLPQQLSADIQPGIPATLHLPQYPDRAFKASVATTAEAINRVSRTLLVELHADNPDGLLQAGAYLEVHFQLPGDPNVLTIPTSALLFREGGLKVAVLGADDKVELRSIELGRNLGSDVDVRAGITPTDRVINHPPDSLTAGETVRVATEPMPDADEQAANPDIE